MEDAAPCMTFAHFEDLAIAINMVRLAFLAFFLAFCPRMRLPMPCPPSSRVWLSLDGSETLLLMLPAQGTNLPSCATPNGQAAFLFILTSAVSPLVQLSYMKMVSMMAPYTAALSCAGLIGVLTMNVHD